MKNNSFLIRFIDIGLILLFGFIIISDITVRSQIELPGSDPGEPSEDRQPLVMTIEVESATKFRVSEVESERLIGVFDSVEELENGLLQYRNQIRSQGLTPLALLELSAEAKMQTFIDVLDLCDKLGIPKNVNEETLRL
ncbi:ExbD/TolR family protein [Rhodohalobacter sp. 8-1]|uniref:ExbD/TolR family protein n=1 Tax=Rhodohalobacter sp. 8-1 TaxID=3131972 RepID=UPI0030ED0D95